MSSKVSTLFSHQDLIGGTWQPSATDRSWSFPVERIAAAMVVLPVFLQAPWVRLDPFSATLFTAVLIGVGLVLHRSRSQTASDLGSLLVGFSGSWLAGCIFWGWLRAHPVLHLPIEAFALPIALGGLNGPWRLAATFYLSSLVGTACTDLAMAATGVMRFWPSVVTASLDQAPLLLHAAGMQLLNPIPILLLIAAATAIVVVSRRLNQRGTGSMASAVLLTTLWVDGLFLLTALIQPSLSGLIE